MNNLVTFILKGFYDFIQVNFFHASHFGNSYKSPGSFNMPGLTMSCKPINHFRVILSKFIDGFVQIQGFGHIITIFLS